MALKAYVDTLDGIDESLRDHYVEKDGGYYLSLDDFGKHPGAVTLKTTLNRVNKDKEDLLAQVTELKDKVGNLPDDFDAEEYARLKSGQGDAGEALEALRKKYANDTEALTAQIKERDAYIDSTLVDGGLKDSLIEVGVMPELMDGALATLRSNVKVQRSDDGKRTAIVETELGDVPVSEFVKTWASGKGKAYLGKPSGPGGDGNNGGANSPRTQGNLGGDKSERKEAIASRFPELQN